MELNFWEIQFEPQGNRLTFHLTNGASECKIHEINAKVFMYLKSRRNAIQAGALVACLPSFVFSQNNSSDLGSPIPWSQIKLLNDEVLQSSQLKGQVLVTYFWASWCPFCAHQSPEIEKLFVKHQSKGLYVLGVSVDKDLSAAKIHMQKNRYSFPSTWLDPQLKSDLKKPSSVPVVMVHDKLGQLVQYEKGQMFAEDVQALSRWI